MINQFSGFKNYVNEDNRKDDFMTKIDNLNRKFTRKNTPINDVPNYISLKITNAEKKFMQNRVFWNKEKMEDIRKKLRMAKEKIKLKNEIFLEKIQQAIIKGEKEKIL
jgi:hypothetical protein